VFKPSQGGTKPDFSNVGNTTPEPVKPIDLPRQNYTEKAFGLDMDMVWVEGGSFTMGCKEGRDTDCLKSEKPAHRVTLDGYYMGRTEVTQAQWRTVMGTNPSHFKNCDDCPVEEVSLYDIQGFLQKLKDQTGQSYRLPTEAEWEYAARGGQNTRNYQYAGSNTLRDVAWYDSSSESKTHPVAQKKPNELGLYDMTGNVDEWCADWYGSDYYAYAPSSNPQGATSGLLRVLRGGSWDSNARYCRVSHREHYAPDYSIYFGFRICL
jgi:formylglycine-generating enzyme required for sulfatase activity